jgi:hypothetical protein
MNTKPSEIFEGENSSLRKTFDEAVHKQRSQDSLQSEPSVNQMNTNEIKEKFEESAEEAKYFVDYAKVLSVNQATFLCNLAIKKREEEIQTDIIKHLNGFFDWAEQIKAQEIGHWEVMYGLRPEEFKQMIISLINKNGK